MHIYIDADACPVKDETIKVAQRYELPVSIVSNGGLRPSRVPLVTNVSVPSGADAADDWIVDNMATGDVVITADIPLAARVLDKSGFAIGPTGRIFSQESIGNALATRALKQHIRESTQTQTFNRSFSNRDRSNFLQSLDRIIVQAQKSGR